MFRYFTRYVKTLTVRLSPDSLDFILWGPWMLSWDTLVWTKLADHLPAWLKPHVRSKKLTHAVSPAAFQSSFLIREWFQPNLWDECTHLTGLIKQSAVALDPDNLGQDHHQTWVAQMKWKHENEQRKAAFVFHEPAEEMFPKINYNYIYC